MRKKDSVADLLENLVTSIPTESAPTPGASKKPFVAAAESEAEEIVPTTKPVFTEDDIQPPAPSAPGPAPELLEMIRMQNQQLAMLQKQIADMQQPAEPENVTPSIRPEELLREEELGELVDASGMLDSRALYKVLSLLGTRAYQLAREHTIRDIPPLVSQTAQREAAYAGAIATFWQSNKDLQPFGTDVKAEADRVLAENPGYNIHQVLDAAAKRVRTKLSAYSTAQGITSGATPYSAFAQPGSGGQRPDGQDNRTDLQKGLTSLLKGVAPGSGYVR